MILGSVCSRISLLSWRDEAVKFLVDTSRWNPKILVRKQPSCVAKGLPHCDPVIKSIREIPLPVLRYKREHMLESKEWILFNGK